MRPLIPLSTKSDSSGAPDLPPNCPSVAPEPETRDIHHPRDGNHPRASNGLAIVSVLGIVNVLWLVTTSWILTILSMVTIQLRDADPSMDICVNLEYFIHHLNG